jgi:hypothetical protein
MVLIKIISFSESSLLRRAGYGVLGFILTNFGAETLGQAIAGSALLFFRVPFSMDSSCELRSGLACAQGDDLAHLRRTEGVSLNRYVVR